MIPSSPEDSRGASKAFDWSQWYLGDPAAVSFVQGAISRELESSLRVLARRRGWETCYVGANNYFAWIAEPLVRVSPDVYLSDVHPPGPPYNSWQTWRPGHLPPRWALEVVSEDWRKDYRDNPLS